MIPHLRAIVLALCLCSVLPVQAQQPTETPSASSSPGVQSAQIPGSDKPKPAEDQKGPTAEVPVLNPTQTPKDQKPGGNRADSGDGVRADKGEHESYERTIANFTIALAVATFLLMIATGGLWWETRTLASQAKKANEDAQRSIVAAEDSAKAAFATLNINRPWITYEASQFGDATNSQFGNDYFAHAFIVRVALKNVGATPALQLNFAIDLKFCGPEDDIPIFDLISPPGTYFSLGRDGVGWTNWCAADISHAERLFKKEIRGFIHIKSAYRSFFGEDLYESEIRSQIEISHFTRDGDGRVQFVAALMAVQQSASEGADTGTTKVTSAVARAPGAV